MKKINYIEEMVYEPLHDPKTICEGNIDGIDFKIKSLGSHPTAYIKVPNESSYFGSDYNEIPINIHGGLTYGQLKNNNEFWIGWDYAHFGDYCYMEFNFGHYKNDEKKYTTNEILIDVENAIKQLNEITEIENSELFKNEIKKYRLNLLELILKVRGNDL